MKGRMLTFVAIVALCAGTGCSGCSDDAGGTSNGTSNGSSNGNSNGNSNGTNNGSDTATDGTEDGEGDGIDPDATATCNSVNFLEVYQPNVYLLVDRSSSMEGEPMSQAKSGLDDMADRLADRIRFGAGGYPIPSSGCGMARLIEMGSHSSEDMKAAWADLDSGGGTPTGTALYSIQDQNRLTEPGDEFDDKRQKAVVLITDGDPTICEDEHPSNEEAQTLLEDYDAPVFVVGFRSQANPDNLNALAEAGGTDAPGSNRFYTAENPGELTNAILDISENVIGCTQPVRPPPESADLLTVELEGDILPQDADEGFTYDESTQEITIHGSYCETLQSGSQDGQALKIIVNCPDCTGAGQDCSSDGECCSGICEDGVCRAPCSGLGETCVDSGDCCRGSCQRDEAGDLFGTCFGG